MVAMSNFGKVERFPEEKNISVKKMVLAAFTLKLPVQSY